jgi:hypothetical protein
MEKRNHYGGFYEELKSRFMDLVQSEGILKEEICVSTKVLTAEEAIGNTKRKDFPIITGKDVMIQAECMGSLGQAFTDAPSAFKGNLEEICELDLENPHCRSLFVASLNAVMKHLGRTECTVHCKNQGPELCAKEAAAYIHSHYGNPSIALIGYQPALLECLSKDYKVRAVDLNLDHIGQIRFGVRIEDGRKNEITKMLCEEASLVLCTGSTICNGSIVDFLPYKEKALFYGTTLAGAAALMDLPRLCFAGKYQGS